MIVFLLHGYPNGCFMYEKLVKKLIKKKHIPVAINFRTGISADENMKLAREIFATYPKTSKKAVVAHDWGAIISWQLYDEFEKYNIKKFFVMSLSNIIQPNYTFNIARLYQFPLVFSKYTPEYISKLLDYSITPEKYRELEFDTTKSAYYYNLLNAIGIFILPFKVTEANNKNVDTYYIGSSQDKNKGFVNDSLLSEPIKYESHFFYIENTTKINKQIIEFLDN